MSIKPRKVGVLGAGNVGSHVALQIAVQGLADDIVFFDTNTGKAEGEAMDLRDAVSYLPHHVTCTAVDGDELGDCDILVVAIGKTRQPGQTRLDMLADSVEECKKLIKVIHHSGFDGIIISITNPCDVITEYLARKLNWPKNHIIGSGTALDSARLQMQLSEQLNVNRRSVTAYVLGEHGDSSMVPWSHVTVGGKPICELLEENPDKYHMDSFEEVVYKVHRGGYFENANKGCTEFGVSSSTAELIRAIFHNEHKILPCSTWLNGQYGIHDTFASVPVKLGADGVEDVIEIHLTEEEQKELDNSIEILQQHVKKALAL